MEADNTNFLKEVEELIRLFRVLQQKAKSDGVLPDNDPMIGSFDHLADNFNLIKDSIPPEMVNEVAGPIRDMVKELLDQLKEELGDAYWQKEDADLYSEIEKIDARLSKGNLSEEELNQLLDQRSKLDS